jgi:hypothetical protein
VRGERAGPASDWTENVWIGDSVEVERLDAVTTESVMSDDDRVSKHWWKMRHVR